MSRRIQAHIGVGILLYIWEGGGFGAGNGVELLHRT